MKAMRIPKDGLFLHYFCEDCKSDQIHLIEAKEYRNEEVFFAYFCMTCFSAYENKKRLSKAGLLGKIDDFYGTIGKMSNEKWNEFITFSKDE